MKKNVFVALFLAVVMILSCATLFVSADAVTAKAAYVSAAVVPTVDGKVDAVWASTQSVGGVKVLWGDTGFYLCADKADATIVVAEAEGKEQTVTIAAGVVTAPAGSKSAVEDVVEVFVPFALYDEETYTWTYHNFVQEATQRPHTLKFRSVTEDGKEGPEIRVASVDDAIVCDWITAASDIIGKTFTVKVGAADAVVVEFAGPYCQTTTMNGFTDSLDDDDDQITGQSKYNCATINDGLVASDTNTLTAPFKQAGTGTLNGAPYDYALGEVVDFMDPNDNYTADDGSVHPQHRVVTSYDSNLKILPRYAWMPLQITYAAYVTAETAPVVDGMIDSVWATTAKMYHENEIDDPEFDAYGYISVLWSDEGLYMLGVVKDPTVVTIGNTDVCNFFVSEIYNKDIPDAPSSFNTDPAAENKYGSWWIGVGPVGNDRGHNTALVDFEIAGAVTSTGYVAEIFVPYTCTDASFTPAIGHVIGLASSIDNYTDVEKGVAGRDEYTNFGGLSSYWSKPTSQFPVVLVGAYDSAADAIGYKQLSAVVNNALNAYLKKADALDKDTVDGMIMDAVDEAVEDLDAKLEALEGKLADYAKAADVIKASDVDAKIEAAKAGLATESYVNNAVNGIEIPEFKQDNGLAIVALIVAIVAVAGCAVVFVVKKK